MDANLSLANVSCHPDIWAYSYFGALLGSLVTALGTGGNVMTLLAFATEPRLRSHFNLLILNLTLSDLLYCAFLQPITVDTYVHFHWRQGQLACKVFGLALFVANSASIFNLILVAVARYLLITDAQSFERRFRGPTLVLALVLPWALGLALFGPLWDIYVFLPTVCTCSLHRSSRRLYTTIVMAGLFGFGLGTIGLFYFLIQRKVRIASQALEAYRLDKPCPAQGRDNHSRLPPSSSGEDPSRSQVTDTSIVVVGGEAVGERGQVLGPPPPPPLALAPHAGGVPKRSRNGEFQKVTKMCFAMFLVYVACYFPFCVLHVADGKKRAPVVLHTVAGNCTWLNSCINPLLYALMNRQFRAAYLAVLSRAARLLSCCLCPWRSQGHRVVV